MVHLWIANTDNDWFDFLASQPAIDEVNFWQPSGSANFAAIEPGELFLFRLKSPRNAIGGFGIFQHSSNLPITLAWEAFGAKNGAPDFESMRDRVSKYRRNEPMGGFEYTIGCRIVVQPVFLSADQWIELPASWARSIQVGKRYDTQTPEGLQLWERVSAYFGDAPQTRNFGFAEDAPRFGSPTLIQPRLGQGAFRVAITDAYGRACAVSGGKVLPALDAAHIRPYGRDGRHEVRNGILFRRDIHKVFDAGYVTVDKDFRFVVSDRVRTEFNNGEEYRRLHGQKLRLPAASHNWPDRELLDWHNTVVFHD